MYCFQGTGTRRVLFFFSSVKKEVYVNLPSDETFPSNNFRTRSNPEFSSGLRVGSGVFLSPFEEGRDSLLKDVTSKLPGERTRSHGTKRPCTKRGTEP